MKTCYTLAKPALINVVKGVFTNKKLLYSTLIEYATTINAELSFSGAFKYENKKFNYANLNKLLNSILVNESFLVRLITDTQQIVLFEVTLKTFNQFEQ